MKRVIFTAAMILVIAFTAPLYAAEPEPLLAETPLPEKIGEWTDSMKFCFKQGEQLARAFDIMEHEEGVDRIVMLVAKSKMEDIRYITLSMLLVLDCMIDSSVSQNFTTYDTIMLMLDEYNGLLIENCLELRTLAALADVDAMTDYYLAVAANITEKLGKTVNEIRLYESMVYGNEDRTY